MKLTHIIMIILCAFFLQSLSASSCGAQNASKIDWLKGYVSAIGRGYAKKTGTPMDIDNAIEAAKITAQSELLEVIKGVKINSQTAVSDLMTEKTEAFVRVQGILHNSMMLGKPQVREEGSYIVAEVEMRVCLHNNAVECKEIQSLTSLLPKSTNSKSDKVTFCDLLPNLSSTHEILSKISYDTTRPLELVVINLEGKPFNSGSSDIAIGFESENGQKCLIYTPEKVDPVIRRDRGMTEVFLNISDAEKKYGKNILKVKVQSISRDNYIIIDKKDAYLINLINNQAKQDLFRYAKFGIAAK